MSTLVTLSLRVALVLLLVGSVVLQVLLPVYASEFGTRTPEVAHLVVPYSVAAILFVACGQAILVAIWRLLSMIGVDVIFTRRALRWVDAIIVSGATATALTTAVLAHMLFFFIPGGAGPVVFYLAAVIAAGVTFVLLVTVMKGLLAAAIADRTELEGVI